MRFRSQKKGGFWIAFQSTNTNYTFGSVTFLVPESTLQMSKPLQFDIVKHALNS